MSIRWEKFVGRTDAFAARIRFLEDPDDGVAATAEESASWGSIELWVNGQNLCAHSFQGETLQAAHWYMLPLVEWFIENWDPIFHETRLPLRNSADSGADALWQNINPPALAEEVEMVAWEEEWFSWHQRHALRSARQGGILPNLVIRRVLDQIEFSWRDQPLAGVREAQFLATGGSELFEPSEIALRLHDLLSAAVDHLMVRVPASPQLHALRHEIEALSAPGAREDRILWLAGVTGLPPLERQVRGRQLAVDLRARWDQIVDGVRELAGERLDRILAYGHTPLVVDRASQPALLFGSTSPAITHDDARELCRVLVEAYSDKAAVWAVDEFSEHVDVDDDLRPWEHGYELAEALLADLQFDDSWVDIEGMLAELDVSVTVRSLQDDQLRGCSIVGDHYRPTIVVNSRYGDNSEEVRRFTLAHELCHVLYDRQQGNRLAVASGPWAPATIEKRANAFAAMLLMPTRLVREAVADLSDPLSDQGSVSGLAAKLKVSWSAVVLHLYNLTLLTDADRARLLGRY